MKTDKLKKSLIEIALEIYREYLENMNMKWQSSHGCGCKSEIFDFRNFVYFLDEKYGKKGE